MNDAAQIRRCNGALGADPVLPQTPNQKISNRESLRRVRADDSARRNDDVINVTQTKQTTQPHCNRELEALFSIRVRADDSARAGGPAFSEGSEVGAPSFPVLVYGKGGVLRPRFRLRFLYLPQTFALVRIIK